ncbi:hypothetical protein A6A28_09305 [Streptomyces sp. CB03578]|uniref:SHOCT domain-containing protein n=1 Tax=Streptomyces sp. CB03578 TaxID=1718987 RepID=UPI00093BD06D|nr:SHOCT domain-containing protein [Streptomyces sp. CB03578]OKI29478.1 hypothetical protein A6A28_09305 [Streptomyces sp. CB03578]
MFIRPVGVTVSAAVRPAGRPLLRGLLARATTGTAPGYGDAGRSRSAEQGAGAYAYADPYAEEPPYPEPDDADEPDWSEPAERGAEPGDEPGPGARTPAADRAAEPYAGLPAELAQLAGLAREGLLTPEEFAAAKALLLHP